MINEVGGEKSTNTYKKFVELLFYYIRMLSEHACLLGAECSYWLLLSPEHAYNLPARNSRSLRISNTYLRFFVKNCHNGL